MANILVNGLKSKTGGGKSILKTYLTYLRNDCDGHKYYALTPNEEEYAHFNSDCIKILETPNLVANNALFLILYYYYFPKILNDLKIDAIMNYGDIPIRGRTPQLYLFDWSFGSHPESIAWKRLDRGERLSQRIKLFVFKRFIKYADIVMVQSVVTRDRLRSLYGAKRLEVVPNAVSLDNLDTGEYRDFGLPQGRKKLLYITHYYTHKNIEIFIEVARRIREHGLEYSLITTFSADQHPGAARFHEQVDQENLGDIIINVGPVPGADIASLFKQCDGLLMPTLLESFSGSYVESMHHRRPIFTSNFDFAEAVCGHAAFYFDPLDSRAIVDTLNDAYGDDKKIEDAVNRGSARLAGMWNWDRVYGRTQELLMGLLAPKPGNG